MLTSKVDKALSDEIINRAIRTGMKILTNSTRSYYIFIYTYTELKSAHKKTFVHQAIRASGPS